MTKVGKVASIMMLGLCVATLIMADELGSGLQPMIPLALSAVCGFILVQRGFKKLPKKIVKA